MKNAFLILSSVFILLASRVSSADDEFKSAVEKTKAEMKDKRKRQNLLDTDKAKEADKAANSVTGNEENTEELYGISADLLSVIGEQAEGDPEKMNKILEEAQRDPAAFYKRLPEEQRKRIQSLSKKIENNKAPSDRKSP